MLVAMSLEPSDVTNLYYPRALPCQRCDQTLVSGAQSMVYQPTILRPIVLCHPGSCQASVVTNMFSMAHALQQAVRGIIRGCQTSLDAALVDCAPSIP